MYTFDEGVLVLAWAEELGRPVVDLLGPRGRALERDGKNWEEQELPEAWWCPLSRPLNLSHSRGGKQLKAACETRAGHFGAQVGPTRKREA